MEIALHVHVRFDVFCQISSDILDQFSQSFHQMKAFLSADDGSRPLFFDISRDVAMAPDFVKKNGKLCTLVALAFRNGMGSRHVYA